MVVGNRQLKELHKYAVELAVGAVEGNANPLDMDMRDIDPAPTSLDLILPGKRGNRHAVAAAAQAGGSDVL